jgi:hypothetical protein
MGARAYAPVFVSHRPRRCRSSTLPFESSKPQNLGVSSSGIACRVLKRMFALSGHSFHSS